MKKRRTRRQRFVKRPNDDCRHYANGPYVLVVSKDGNIVTVMPRVWFQ